MALVKYWKTQNYAYCVKFPTETIKNNNNLFKEFDSKKISPCKLNSTINVLPIEPEESIQYLNDVCGLLKSPNCKDISMCNIDNESNNLSPLATEHVIYESDHNFTENIRENIEKIIAKKPPCQHLVFCIFWQRGYLFLQCIRCLRIHTLHLLLIHVHQMKFILQEGLGRENILKKGHWETTRAIQ